MTFKQNFFSLKQLFIFCIGILTLQTAHSQCIVENIVARYGNTTDGSSPGAHIIAGDYLYFTADDGIRGRELWLHNFLTKETTTIDINVGKDESRPTEFLLAKDRVYFRAEDTRGNILYSVPLGTLDTTSVYFNPSHPGNFQFRPYVYEDKIFFSVESKELGQELYIMEAGTMDYEILDINEGVGGSNPGSFFGINGKLYFSARKFFDVEQGIYDTELQILEVATNTLTRLDLRPGNEGSNPFIYAVINNKIYFSAGSNSDGSRRLYMMSEDDHTDTTSISGLTLPFSEDVLHVIENSIYFSAFTSNRGWELWKMTAGTLDTTMIDLYPGSIGATPLNMYVANDKLYFSAHIPNKGQELCIVTGGTLDTLIIDIELGFSFGFPDNSYPGTFVEMGGKLYFSATKNDEKRLFSIDIVTNDTASVDFSPYGQTSSIDIASYGEITDYQIIEEQLYFVVENEDGAPFIGTIKGGTTNDTASIQLEATDGVELKGVYNDLLLFTQNNRIFGREFFTYDKSNQAIDIVKDINVRTPNTGLSNFVKTADVAYFTANNYVNGNELYMMDLATEEITFVDINPGAEGAKPQHVTLIGEFLYFTADDGKRGREIWKINVGTLDTTSIDINVGSGSSFPSSNDVLIRSPFVEAGGKVYFGADDGSKGRELYMVTKGMLDTTSVGINNNAEFASSPKNFRVLGGRLYFTISTSSGVPLCSVPAGTLDYEIHPSFTSPYELAIAGNYLYFREQNNNINQLFVVEGGTMNVTEVTLPENVAIIGHIVPENQTAERLYFSMRTPEEGMELYYTIPGSTTVTPMFINSGAEGAGLSSYFYGKATTDNSFYFTAYDGSSTSVYVSKAGSDMPKKIEGTSDGSFIEEVDGKLYFNEVIRNEEGDRRSTLLAIDLASDEVEIIHEFSTRISNTFLLGDVFYFLIQTGEYLRADDLGSFNLQTKELKIFDINKGVFVALPKNIFAYNETIFFSAYESLEGGGIFYQTKPFEAGTGSEMTVASTDQINLSELVTGGEIGGTWERTSGTGGTFDAMAGTVAIDANFTTSEFLYLGQCYPDTAFVKLMRAPCPVVNAGRDTSVCNNTYSLMGTALATGETGQWTFVNNPDNVGTLINPTSPTAKVSVTFSSEDIFENNSTSSHTVTLQWKVTSANCSEGVSDEVTIILTPPVSAGVDRLNICGTNITLGATPASGGTGTWSFVTNPNNSGQLNDLNLHNATLTGVIGGSYELEWMVTGGVCNGSMDKVLVSFQPDSDNDTFQDCVDLCQGGDDNINSDNTGVPDDCDCSPNSAENELVTMNASEYTIFVNEQLQQGVDTVKRIADFQLTSSATVEAKAIHKTVVFQASNAVILQAGFHAKASSDFMAKIGYCRPPNAGAITETDLPINQVVRALPNSTPSLKKEVEMLVFPNPVQQEAAIKLKLPSEMPIDLALINQNGQLVRSYLQGAYQAMGEHYYRLDAAALPSGVYFLQLRSATGVVTQKLVVQR